MMWLDCPRAVTEPPTCTGKDHCGSIRFNIQSPEYDVGVGPQPEADEQTCTCVLSPEEWSRLENEAVERYNEGTQEP